METEVTEVLSQARSNPDKVDRPVRTARTTVHHYNSTQYCSTEPVARSFERVNSKEYINKLGGCHNMPRPVTLTFDLEVGVGVACDLGYPCAKFRIPRPFGFRVSRCTRHQTDRQTDGAGA